MNLEYVTSTEVESADDAISILDNLVELKILENHSLKQRNNGYFGEVMYQEEHFPVEYGPFPWVPTNDDRSSSESHLYISWVLSEDIEIDGYYLNLLGELKNQIHNETDLEFNDQIDTQAYDI